MHPPSVDIAACRNHIVLSASACGDIDGRLKRWRRQIAALSRRGRRGLIGDCPMTLSTAMFQGGMAVYQVYAGQPATGAWRGPSVTP